MGRGQLINRRLKVAIAVLSAVVVLAEAAPALAFDRGPHTELTYASMTDEGFGTDATGVAEVNNWFVDLYHELSIDKLPVSGHAGAFKRVLVGVAKTEGWSQALISAATRSHFDNNPDEPLASQMPSLKDTAGIQAEWDRLQRAVWTLVLEAREEDNVEKLLTVMGMSLHPVQDFYSHTNWIEPPNGPLGTDGPGWQEHGFGSNPTWFDVPAEERNKVMVYGDSTPSHSRIHGLWSADNGTSLANSMNKDWPGRPLHTQAVESAYFASRQWIEAIRMWVNDEEFWQKAQSYRAGKSKDELEHDRKGMFEIMLTTGHWQGQGEPLGGLDHGAGGSLLDARQAVKDYFQPTATNKTDLVAFALNPFTGLQVAFVADRELRGPSRYRTLFQHLIMRMAEPSPRGKIGPVPSSQDMQRATQFVELRVLSMHAREVGDPGPDDADLYTDVMIDGQPATSAIFHGHDNTNFPNPYEPFTWVKAIPAEPDRGEPVESVQLEVKTADVNWAGTNDDLYLQLGGSPAVRFTLDKRLYDDFERDNRDTYSIPIDDAVTAGMEVGDISRVQLVKADDGVAGGWKLGGVKLIVNGRVIYNNQDVNRWLEDDHVTWRAPDFERRDPRSKKIPVVIRLRESDTFYLGDDDGDINPYERRDVVSVGYMPGIPFEATAKGGNSLMGRLGYDSKDATITYRLDTVTPEPMGPIGEPTAIRTLEGAQPDLVVSDFFFGSVTVTNQGAGPAGPFRLRAVGNGLEDTVSFPGLGPGASATEGIRLRCDGFYFATVDDLNQVSETDENNNEAVSEPVIC